MQPCTPGTYSWRKQGSTGGMTQVTIVEVNQATPATEEKMTLGALQAMMDLWAKHHGERKTSITLTDAESFVED